MEYVHAAILLHRAGKPINEKNLTNVLSAAGIKTDPIRVKALVASLAEVDIEEAIKSPPAFMTAAPAPAAAAAPAAEEKPAEAKKKTKEEEKKKEEAAIEGLGALFG
ncbi:MAG: 50S ribosomal protein P1 [Candidatus Bathyarchaeota archaeon]|nr:MAG: 50S ribosomal protein P1 [Candidatus Bathyarchaeota archaeon]